jgi:hypothetical protein
MTPFSDRTFWLCRSLDTLDKLPLAAIQLPLAAIQSPWVILVFSPFYRPRRSLGRVGVYRYSIFRPRHYKGRGVSVTPRPLYIPRKDPVPIVQEAGWAPGPVWTGAENLAPHRDSIPAPSSPQPVAILTELPGGPFLYVC